MAALDDDTGLEQLDIRSPQIIGERSTHRAYEGFIGHTANLPHPLVSGAGGGGGVHRFCVEQADRFLGTEQWSTLPHRRGQRRSPRGPGILAHPGNDALLELREAPLRVHRVVARDRVGLGTEHDAESLEV